MLVVIPAEPIAAFSTGNLSNGTVAPVNSNGSSPYIGGRSLTFGGTTSDAGARKGSTGHHSTSAFQEVVSKAVSVDEKLSASRYEKIRLVSG